MKKEKTITLKPKNITQKQWINLLLELNLMRKAWKTVWCRHHDTGTGDQENNTMGNKSWRTNIRSG